jgi:hypothetical protein
MFNTHTSYPRGKTGGFDNDEKAPVEESIVQTEAQTKLESYIGWINSPKDLATTERKLYKQKA